MGGAVTETLDSSTTGVSLAQILVATNSVAMAKVSGLSFNPRLIVCPNFFPEYFVELASKSREAKIGRLLNSKRNDYATNGRRLPLASSAIGVLAD